VAVAVVAVVALLGRGCSRVELCVAGIVRESAIWWSVAMARAIGGGPCGPPKEVCFGRGRLLLQILQLCTAARRGA